MKSLLFVVLVACNTPNANADMHPAAAVHEMADGGVAVSATGGASKLSIVNSSGAATTVFIAFGADSAITHWAFCPVTARLNCQFNLAAGASQAMPLDGKYLNATMSFGAAVSCGQTKAELNLNNPKWYDIADVSLVDGYSNKVAIEVANASGKKLLGPPKGKEGNSKVYGLFPLGCDICTARQHPPCGMSPGKGDCKGGTQYKPDVICQWQGATMGGGTAVKVELQK